MLPTFLKLDEMFDAPGVCALSMEPELGGNYLSLALRLKAGVNN